MSKTYVVVSNATIAKIYAYPDNNKTALKPVTILLHAPSKQKEQELTASDYGTFRNNGTGGKFIPKVDHTKLEKEQFSKEIKAFLKKEKENNQFGNLILISPPEFLGLLKNQELKIVEEHKKDYTSKTESDIITLIWEKQHRKKSA